MSQFTEEIKKKVVKQHIQDGRCVRRRLKTDRPLVTLHPNRTNATPLTRSRYISRHSG